MNTEKIEKFKNGLNNSQISDSIKEKIKEQIARLEKEDLATAEIVVKDEEVIVPKEEEQKEQINVPKPQSKKSKKFTKEFNIGDLVYDKKNEHYGIILNNYGDPINGDSGEIRLDSDGNQSIYEYDDKYNRIGYNIVPYNSNEAVKKIDFAQLKKSANSLIHSAEEALNKSPEKEDLKENLEYYKKAYNRLLSGEFDDKTKPESKEPKRTVLVLAKEIREEGESWAKARERASKLINKGKAKAEVKVKKELEKLDKFIKTRKELEGITGKDLRRDAKRNAKQLGRRTVTNSGETSNQYGTFENKVGKVYYENRDGHGDRLSSKSHRKGMPYLENGGDFMSGVYAEGGNINEEKRFEVDFYTKKTDKEAYYDKTIKAYSVKDVIEKAKKIAKLEEFEYVEIYHNQHFVGSISRDNGFDFVEGTGYDDYVSENETPMYFVNEHGVKVQSKVAPSKKVELNEWIGKTNSSREAMAYAGGGVVDLSKIKTDVYKGFHGLKAETYIDDVNGYDWKIVTLKRYSGQLVSDAQSGKSTKKDNEVELFLHEYKSPNITLISTKPTRITEKVIANQHKEALAIFKEKMEQESFECGGNFMSGVYADGGSILGKTINLVPLELIPLSSQLSRFTGDALASGVYVDEKGNDYSTAEDAIIVHKESGQKFRLPAKIYDYVDGHNLVIKRSGKDFVIVDYNTNLLVAEIIDGKLDFSNKDESISIDKTKVIKDYEKALIPNEKNADDEYMKIERELNKLYSLYEDNEDDKEKAKEINDYIHHLEGIIHRLERKYSEGGTIEGKNKVIGQTSSGKNVYDGVSEYDKIYKDFTSQDHMDASNIYMETYLSDLNMTRRDEYSAGHYRQTDEYKNDLAERKLRAKGIGEVFNRIPEASKKKFIDYVYAFYGKDGIYAEQFDNDGFKREEIEKAVNKYLKEVTPTNWGGGDTIDRERVRTILEEKSFEVGGTIIGLENPLLQGVVDMNYTDLVGETPAMSSGEMFAKGGELLSIDKNPISKKVQSKINLIDEYAIDDYVGKNALVIADKKYKVFKVERCDTFCEVIPSRGRNQHDFTFFLEPLNKEETYERIDLALEGDTLKINDNLKKIKTIEKDKVTFEDGFILNLPLSLEEKIILPEIAYDIFEQKKYAKGGKIKDEITIVKEKALEILSPKQISMSIYNFEESDELSMTFRSYNKDINVDGLHIGYDKKTKLYQVEEMQAGEKEEDIYIYKRTPSLTIALKEILKGNNRKPIEIIEMGFGKYANGGDVNAKRSRRTKEQIAKDNYNKEVDAYKWYVIDLENKKATSGWEYKSDAQDDLKDNHEGDKNFKVVAKSSLKSMNIPDPNESWKYAEGGEVTFEDKSTAIAKNFVGKKVEPKYQKEYGKVYDKEEAKEVGNKIDGSMVAKEKRKPTANNTKMQKATAYAKANRKEGQSWRDAMKEAFSKVE